MSDDSPDPYEMTLALYNFEVPCIMELADPSCQNQALFLAYLRHGNGMQRDCPLPPMPLCKGHKHFVRALYSKFWSMWMNSMLTACAMCGHPLEIDRIENLKGR